MTFFEFPFVFLNERRTTNRERRQIMAVVIRLSRHGMKKKAFYRVVAADEDYPRDGRYLEVLGTYDPKNKEGKGTFKQERVAFWIAKGAKPSITVAQILKRTEVKAS